MVGVLIWKLFYLLEYEYAFIEKSTEEEGCVLPLLEKAKRKNIRKNKEEKDSFAIAILILETVLLASKCIDD